MADWMVELWAVRRAEMMAVEWVAYLVGHLVGHLGENLADN